MALELFTGGQHGRCVRGKQFSTIAAMCMDGIIDVHITTGSVDSETFCEFIEHCLQPQLLPYDGANPRSVVNNASIHHAQPAIGLIQETGAIPVFLYYTSLFT